MKNSRERLAFQDLHHHCGLRSVSWCAQVNTVATRSISSVDWLGLGILAGRLSTGQQQGGNLQGQAQRTVTAAGSKAGYVWQPTDCIICCPLFVACYPLFLEPPSHKMDMFGLLVAPFAVHCLLHLVLLKEVFLSTLRAILLRVARWLNLGDKTADKKLFIGEGFLIRLIRLPQWAGNGCNLSREG